MVPFELSVIFVSLANERSRFRPLKLWRTCGAVCELHDFPEVPFSIDAFPNSGRHRHLSEVSPASGTKGRPSGEDMPNSMAPGTGLGSPCRGTPVRLFWITSRTRP